MNPSHDVEATAEAMSAVAEWEHMKPIHAAYLYTALEALVGDVEPLRQTSASLSWRTAAGVQGHWREEGDQFWFGRITWTSEGRQSEQLVLALETTGEGEDTTRLAHPTAHYCRSADGPAVGFDRDTPQIYEAAQALLTQLGAELRMMLPLLSQGQEEETQP